ncbi:MAG: aminotransferase class I/II-fold pyridoxal phosphate-dependent enzyme, partial [Eubacteriales bacterium]
MNYESILSASVQEVRPSGIRKFFDLTSEVHDVIALTVGQPDFVTPWHIREAGIKSLEQGKTYYTSNAGLSELRREISLYLSRRFSLQYDPQHEIIVTVGGSEAIDAALRTLINPGDEVIIPEPSFVCYSPLTSLAGGVAVPLQTYEKDHFKLTPESLRAAITDKTKVLVLPYPNNPTGAIMTEEELSAFGLDNPELSVT